MEAGSQKKLMLGDGDDDKYPFVNSNNVAFSLAKYVYVGTLHFPPYPYHMMSSRHFVPPSRHFADSYLEGKVFIFCCSARARASSVCGGWNARSIDAE